jgi:hypothetical protein
MDIQQSDLFDGERVLLSKAANSIIKINDYGLKRLPFDQLMPLVGFQGKEAIGGKLHLTNYRIIFKSHSINRLRGKSINRLRGKFSVFLPTIQDIRDTSQFISKKMAVITQTQTFEFVIWGIPALMKEINSAVQLLTPEQNDLIKSIAIADYKKLGEGLELSELLDKIVRNGPDVADKILGIAQNPISLAGALNLLELLRLATEEKAD